MAGYNDPVTAGSILPIMMLVTGIGKALVKKGLLDKADVIAEIRTFAAVASDPQIMAECNNMIANVSKW